MLGQRLTKHYAADRTVEAAGAAPDETVLFPEVSYFNVDFTSRDSVKRVILDFVPDVIINAAAYTNVDKSESERELAWKINVKGVEHIAEAARVIDAHIIHLSTDYIFDGLNGPYTEADKPNPLGYYGRTKLASENALRISGTLHTIIRTNVLYGIIPNGRLDFVRWVVDAITKKQPIRIVTDQFNNPTFIDDLVLAIAAIAREKRHGIYNIGGLELLSRYDFTRRIIDVFQLDAGFVTPIITEELHQPAKRPLRSGLVILKAQTELDYRPMGLTDSLLLMKEELGL